VNSSNAATQALPEIAPRRDFAKLTPTRTQPIPALQVHREPTLSIIVPIHNEKPKVHSFLLAVERAAEGFKPEVIFVDSGEDATADYIDKIKGRFPFEIRRVQQNPTDTPIDPAAAAAVGFKNAQLDWLCVARVDITSFPQTFSSLLLEGATDSSDLILGSRRYTNNKLRGLSLKVLSLGARFFLPKYLKQLSDPLTNLFVVRRSSLFLNRMAPRGATILPEILKRFPYLEVHELPVQVVSGQVNPFSPSLGEDFRSAISMRRLQRKKKK
jgi:dolichol-phosphate mannosyltransferase